MLGGGMMKEDNMMENGGMTRGEVSDSRKARLEKRQARRKKRYLKKESKKHDRKVRKFVKKNKFTKDEDAGRKGTQAQERGVLAEDKQKSFGQTFKENRKAGKKTFMYKGKSYTTETKEEKAARKMMGGGMSKKKDMYEDGGLRPAPEGNKGKGLRKLPRAVRNKMGYMKKGGMSKYGHGGKMPKKGGVAIMIIANKKSKK